MKQCVTALGANHERTLSVSADVATCLNDLGVLWTPSVGGGSGLSVIRSVIRGIKVAGVLED